jgi:hypothetical protein
MAAPDATAMAMARETRVVTGCFLGEKEVVFVLGGRRRKASGNMEALISSLVAELQGLVGGGTGGGMVESMTKTSSFPTSLKFV